MKRRLLFVGVAVVIAVVLSSGVSLAGPAQGDPPDNPGVCAIVKTLPLPLFVKN